MTKIGQTTKKKKQASTKCLDFKKSKKKKLTRRKWSKPGLCALCRKKKMRCKGQPDFALRGQFMKKIQAVAWVERERKGEHFASVTS